MKTPNTFIIGAPKCGTTAMADYLRTHPDVFLSTPKEPHHFVHEEMPFKSRYADRDEYLKLFDAASNESVVAEASVWYLYSQTAVSNIAAFCPEARIVAMLRRPDEMVYSMHNQSVITYNEDILDFATAWQVAVDGMNRTYPAKCREPSLLAYHRIAAYAEQLERVYRHFPASQVKVIFYDDFKSDTARCYRDVLAFLALDTSHRPAFERINVNQEITHRTLGRLLKSPSPLLLRTLKLLKKAIGIQRLGLRDTLRARIMRPAMRAPLDEALRRDILRYYQPDIERLQVMTGQDLSHWLR